MRLDALGYFSTKNMHAIIRMAMVLQSGMPSNFNICQLSLRSCHFPPHTWTEGAFNQVATSRNYQHVRHVELHGIWILEMWDKSIFCVDCGHQCGIFPTRILDIVPWHWKSLCWPLQFLTMVVSVWTCNMLYYIIHLDHHLVIRYWDRMSKRSVLKPCMGQNVEEICIETMYTIRLYQPAHVCLQWYIHTLYRLYIYIHIYI